MYLKMPKEVTRAARPSRITVGMQEMSATLEVKGDAIEASVSDKDTPRNTEMKYERALWSKMKKNADKIAIQ